MAQTARTPRPTETRPTTVDTETVLSLLSEPYVRDLVSLIGDRPMAARELADELDVSRPTIYRRLNDLQDAGVVEVTMAYEADGHHHKRYQLTVDELSLSFGAGGVELASPA